MALHHHHLIFFPFNSNIHWLIFDRKKNKQKHTHSCTITTKELIRNFFFIFDFECDLWMTNFFFFLVSISYKNNVLIVFDHELFATETSIKKIHNRLFLVIYFSLFWHSIINIIFVCVHVHSGEYSFHSHATIIQINQQEIIIIYNWNEKLNSIDHTIIIIKINDVHNFFLFCFRVFRGFFCSFVFNHQQQQKRSYHIHIFIIHLLLNFFYFKFNKKQQEERKK